MNFISKIETDDDVIYYGSNKITHILQRAGVRPTDIAGGVASIINRIYLDGIWESGLMEPDNGARVKIWISEVSE